MSKAAKPVAPQKVEYNDAVAESKKYFEGDDLAATVWVSKYALKTLSAIFTKRRPSRCTSVSPPRLSASSASIPIR